MEIQTANIRGPVQEISPEALEAMLRQTGTKQLAMGGDVAEDDVTGGDLIIAEDGKITFQPAGADPLKLRGMEVDLPADAENIGFAFGGQPVVFPDPESGAEPQPLTIVGFSIPGGPSFNVFENMGVDFRALQQGQVKAVSASPADPLLARAVAQMNQLQIDQPVNMGDILPAVGSLPKLPDNPLQGLTLVNPQMQSIPHELRATAPHTGRPSITTQT
ncbi:hypothetical protein GNI_132070, partial [Gregarina niphandrodes]